MQRTYQFFDPSKDSIPEDKPLYKFRAWVIGEDGVGKSQLLTSFCDENSRREVPHSKYTQHFEKKNVTLSDGKQYSYDFLDVPVRQLRTGSYEQIKQCVFSVNAVVIAFDLTARTTFEKIQEHINNIKSGLYSGIRENAKIYLIACKQDLVDEREVTWREVQLLAKNNNIICAELNARNQDAVRGCFDDITMSYMSYMDQYLADLKIEKVAPTNNSNSRCTIS